MIKAGFSKIDITPPVGTPLGGNWREDYASKGVKHPLHAKAVFIDGGDSSWVVAMADLVVVTPEMVSEIRTAACKNTGLALDQIIIAAIHTHSGPAVEEGSTEESTATPEVIAEINRKIAEVIALAVESAEEVSIYYGRGENDKIGHNRRLRTKDGQTHMNWEGIDPDFIAEVLGPTDPEISVLKFVGSDGEIKSILVNYTCHPAILAGDNWLMSADYPGFMYQRLEQEYGDNVVVIFSTGSTGNVNHIDNFDPTQGRGFEEAERLGVMLAEDVIEIMASMTDPEKVSTGCSREVLNIPRRHIDDERVVWAKKILDAWDGKPFNMVDGLPDELYAREALLLKELESEPVNTEVVVFRLSEDTAIVSMPGEPFVEFGLEIKEKSPFPHTFIIEQANGRVGYIPTRKGLEEGGYEPTPKRNSQLDPCAGEMLVASALNQLNELRK